MLKKMLIRKNVNTRAFPRIDFFNFIKYKLEWEPKENFNTANIKNISGSGLLFVSKKELAKDSILDVIINFPGTDSIDAKAQVVRSIRSDSGFYEVGAHFVNIDEEKRAELAKRINFVLQKMSSRKSFWSWFKK